MGNRTRLKCLVIRKKLPVHPLKTINLALLLCLLASSVAHARCEGAAMLGQLHDAYLASLIETGDTRISGARTLLVVVGGKNAAALSRQVRKTGIEIPQERLLDVMQAGAKLAHSILLGDPVPNDLFQHSRNVDWLGAIVYKAHCQNGVLARKLRTSEPSKKGGAFEFPKPNKESLPVFAAGLVALVVALALLTILVPKSRAFRVFKAARLPRSPFTMEFHLTITDQDGELMQTTATGVDISAGGMKLGWPDGPPAGTAVRVSLPFGERLASVVWSNAHFAGIIFDDVLNKKELASFSKNDPPEKETAPEGAVSEVQP